MLNKFNQTLKNPGNNYSFIKDLNNTKYLATSCVIDNS
jgi:hypothetical protein